MSLWGYRSPLGRYVPMTVDKERVKREGWREQGIVVVAADDERLDWVEREFVQRLGNRLYGKRAVRRG